VVDGNSFVVRVVGSGEAWLGLTDSDDIAAGQRDGLPIAALPVTAETLLIPNTVAIAEGAPHPQAAQKLFEFLQRPETAQRLVAAQALESAANDQAGSTLKVNWDSLLKDLEPVTAELNRIFLR
jgi:iron(III) transport system substrate-binding protein